MTPHGIRYTPSTAQVLKELDGWTHLIQWFASLLLDLIIYSLISQGCFYPLWWPSHLLLLVIHLFFSVFGSSVSLFLFISDVQTFLDLRHSECLRGNDVQNFHEFSLRPAHFFLVFTFSGSSDIIFSVSSVRLSPAFLPQLCTAFHTCSWIH